MKFPLRPLSTPALPLALALCALPFFASCGKKNEFAPPPPTEVGVQSPIIRDQPTYMEFPGHLEAQKTVNLRARVKGILKTVSPDFRPGHKIKKGTVVFGIDDVPYQAALLAAEAQLAQAKSSLNIAEITLQRRETAAEAISKIQIDIAKANVDGAKAMVQSAEANLINAKETLSWCKITAPISGRISELQVDQYNLVGNNEATLLATIVQDDTLRAYFEINERIAIHFLGSRQKIRNQVEVTLTLADGSLYPHPAKIDYADAQLDSQTGTIRVRAIVPNPDEKLADGLYVKVKVPTGKDGKNTILIPSIAIQQDLGGHFVLCVTSENKVLRKNIQLADRIDRLRIVTSGLTGKEKIILQGLQRVREGMTVAPSDIPAEKTTPPGKEQPKTLQKSAAKK